eukprot:327763-Chlamydomonas_euryale.AAC.2
MARSSCCTQKSNLNAARHVGQASYVTRCSLGKLGTSLTLNGVHAGLLGDLIRPQQAGNKFDAEGRACRPPRGAASERAAIAVGAHPSVWLICCPLTVYPTPAASTHPHGRTLTVHIACGIPF